MNSIKLYWSASKPNFGDWLSPKIVAAQTPLPVEHAPPKHCDLMGIGSILHKAKNHWWTRPVDVWGSGFMHDCKAHKTRHRIHLVRGALTRARLLNATDAALGDPGLLVSTVMADVISEDKSCAVGIVPHYKDREDPQVREFFRKYPDTRLINVLDDLDTVIRQISECEFIASSSLHGLIMADAMGIPNQWLVLSDQVAGNNFKFHDYYSVFAMETPGPVDLFALDTQRVREVTSAYSRPGLADVQRQIANAFPRRFQ